MKGVTEDWQGEASGARSQTPQTPPLRTDLARADAHRVLCLEQLPPQHAAVAVGVGVGDVAHAPAHQAVRLYKQARVQGFHGIEG